MSKVRKEERKDERKEGRKKGGRKVQIRGGTEEIKLIQQPKIHEFCMLSSYLR